MTPSGNKLVGEITLRGVNSVGKERYFAEILNENSAGDTIDMFFWKI